MASSDAVNVFIHVQATAFSLLAKQIDVIIAQEGDLDSYRLVYITSCVAKVMGELVYTRLNWFVAHEWELPVSMTISDSGYTIKKAIRSR